MATHTVNVIIPMSSRNTQKLINTFTSGANLNHGDVCLHTHFNNIGLCMHWLGHIGPSIMFVGGVGGQMGRV